MNFSKFNQIQTINIFTDILQIGPENCLELYCIYYPDAFLCLFRCFRGLFFAGFRSRALFLSHLDLLSIQEKLVTETVELPICRVYLYLLTV